MGQRWEVHRSGEPSSQVHGPTSMFHVKQYRKHRPGDWPWAIEWWGFGGTQAKRLSGGAQSSAPNLYCPDVCGCDEVLVSKGSCLNVGILSDVCGKNGCKRSSRRLLKQDQYPPSKHQMTSGFHVKHLAKPPLCPNVSRETRVQLQMMHRNTAIIPQLPNPESLPSAAILRCFIRPSLT